MDATTIGARGRGSTRYPNWFESSWVRTVAGLEAGGRPLTLPLRQGPRRPPSAGGRLQRPQNAYGVAAGGCRVPRLQRFPGLVTVAAERGAGHVERQGSLRLEPAEAAVDRSLRSTGLAPAGCPPQESNLRVRRPVPARAATRPVFAQAKRCSETPRTRGSLVVGLEVTSPHATTETLEGGQLLLLRGASKSIGGQGEQGSRSHPREAVASARTGPPERCRPAPGRRLGGCRRKACRPCPARSASP